MNEIEEWQEADCTLYRADCFDLLPTLELTADLVLSDPPYNCTHCDWDVHIPLSHFWQMIERKAKPAANYVLFGCGHIAVDLVNSRYKWYRYDLIWSKNNRCGFLNSHKQPLRSHESILIFGKPGFCNETVYNPQKEVYCKPKSRKIQNKQSVYPARSYTSESDGTRHPCSVLHFTGDKDRADLKGIHPTLKPLALTEFLVKSYSNDGDLVIDPFMGSGTTGVACVKHGRRFIGIEKEKKYFDIAVKRINEAVNQQNSARQR
jgi:site-specific DNA-methyltransferase (adenine-specific)